MQQSIFDLYFRPYRLREKPKLYAYRSSVKAADTPDSIKWEDCVTPGKSRLTNESKEAGRTKVTRVKSTLPDTTTLPLNFPSPPWNSMCIPPSPNLDCSHQSLPELYQAIDPEFGEMQGKMVHGYMENKNYWDKYHQKVKRNQGKRRSCGEFDGQKTRFSLKTKTPLPVIFSLSNHKPEKAALYKQSKPLFQSKMRLNLSATKF